MTRQLKKKTDKIFSSDPNKGKEKNINVEMILTTDAQFQTFGVNEHTKLIYIFFFAGSVTRRIETMNTENEGLF